MSLALVLIHNEREGTVECSALVCNSAVSVSLVFILHCFKLETLTGW